jgi:hypothetical protein
MSGLFGWSYAYLHNISFNEAFPFVPILLRAYHILLTADVVASFRLQRMISELSGNKSKLEYDIFEEIGINNTVVCFTSFFIYSDCP